MIDLHCVSSEVDRANIARDADISGSSYVTGSQTVIESGVILRDARVHNAHIEGGAHIVDSIVVSDGEPLSHNCDAAGRCRVSGAEISRIGGGSQISGCTLINTSVGTGTRIVNSTATNCQLDEGNVVMDAKLTLVGSSYNVTVTGPTEISEAWLGHHANIDQRGYFEGIFCNKLHKLQFNEATGKLEAIGCIDLPHVSFYGVNTIISTNSGKLRPQVGGQIEGLGPYRGLWSDSLGSHDQVRLGPCCWVAPWTKVVGQSARLHNSDDDLVNDRLTTYLMPFALAGYGGDSTRGLVMPGELSIGFGPKERFGAWVFTYAPEAVIDMVRRLYLSMERGAKHITETIVIEAIKTALAMTKAMAHEHSVDLSVAIDSQKPGWPRWIARTYALLCAHLDGELWNFVNGRPDGWRSEDGVWRHPNMGGVLAIAPDAIENQVPLEQLLACVEEIELPEAKVPLSVNVLQGSGGEPEISPDADISPGAMIGPGCRIGSGVVIEQGALVWNSLLQDSHVGAGSTVERTAMVNSSVGAGSTIRSCVLNSAKIGDKATAVAASIVESDLADFSRVTTFADVRNVQASCGSILGGQVHWADIQSHLVSMHMAGGCEHFKAIPTGVKLEGMTVLIPAAVMIGGGAVIRGTPEAPVLLECSFIGSNAIIEAGCYVGFGCFVRGRLTAGGGLLPFTMSLGSDLAGHRIGGVLGDMASVVLTHFVSWAYQATGYDFADAVALLPRQAIQRGIAAVEWELARREGAQQSDSEGFDRYKTMSAYSREQLRTGLEIYTRSLESGAWEMAYRDGQLTFTSPKGNWVEKDGSAFWKKS